MRFSRSIGLIVLAMVPLCLSVASSLAAVPTTATRSVLQANPGLKAMVEGERLVALYGAPFATDADEETDTDQFVANFLLNQANVDALGVDGAELVFEKKVTIRNGKFCVYTYSQTIDGVPVHGSVVKIPVLLGPTEKISYIGMHLSQHPSSPFPLDDPDFDEQDAIGVVQASPFFGHLTNFPTVAEVDKVIFEASPERLHRAWRFTAWGGNESYLFFVDTSSREIVGVESLVHDIDVAGKVTGFATPCRPAADPDCPGCCLPDLNSDPPVEMELVGAHVTAVTGSYTCPSDEGTVVAGPNPTNASGQYDLSGVPNGARVISRLEGDFVTVVSCGSGGGSGSTEACYFQAKTGTNTPIVACEVVDSSDPSPVDFVLNAHLCEGGSNPGYPCDCPGASCDIVTELCTGGSNSGKSCEPDRDCFGGGLCADHPPQSAETAQVNAFIGVSATRDWFLSLQPGFTGLDQNLLVLTTASGLNNARYYADPEFLIFSAETDIYYNWAIYGMVAHEFGHFAWDQIHGTTPGTFHESVADLVSAMSFNTPLIAPGLCKSAATSMTPYRNIDMPDTRFNEQPTEPALDCEDCTQIWISPHCLGRAFWFLRQICGSVA